MIDIDLGRKIFKKAKPPKKWIEIPNGGHITAMQMDDGKYRKMVLKYLENPIHFIEQKN